jgi:hypothetical protein
MVITFIEHVLERMQQRNITQKQILKALKDPKIIMPTTKGTTKIFNTVDNKKICVIVSKKPGFLKVITAWWR